MSKKYFILVTNDDGVHAPGVDALARAMTPLGDVLLVAPSQNQSAASHSITLNRPLRVHTFPDRETKDGNIRVRAVDGTPSDCVYMAVHKLCDRLPDLVVSGINHGGNLGNDLAYSGTVSAALEGAFCGISSIAFSQVGSHGLDFTYAARFATQLARSVLEKTLDHGVILNVNVPKHVKKEGYAVTVLGQHSYTSEVDERTDPRGKKYYWIGGEWGGYKDLPGTDCKAIAEGQISVTPIRVELTSHKHLSALAALDVQGFEMNPAYTSTLPREEGPGRTL